MSSQPTPVVLQVRLSALLWSPYAPRSSTHTRKHCSYHTPVHPMCIWISDMRPDVVADLRQHISSAITLANKISADPKLSAILNTKTLDQMAKAVLNTEVCACIHECIWTHTCMCRCTFTLTCVHLFLTQTCSCTRTPCAQQMLTRVVHALPPPPPPPPPTPTAVRTPCCASLVVAPILLLFPQ